MATMWQQWNDTHVPDTHTHTHHSIQCPFYFFFFQNTRAQKLDIPPPQKKLLVPCFLPFFFCGVDVLAILLTKKAKKKHGVSRIEMHKNKKGGFFCSLAKKMWERKRRRVVFFFLSLSLKAPADLAQTALKKKLFFGKAEGQVQFSFFYFW